MQAIERRKTENMLQSEDDIDWGKFNLELKIANQNFESNYISLEESIKHRKST